MRLMRLLVLTLLLALVIIPPPGIARTRTSLTFGGATSDTVNCGTGSVFDNLTDFTVYAWVTVTTATTNRCIVGNFRGAVDAGWEFSSSGTTGNLTLSQGGTTYLTYITSSTPVGSLNTWFFVAASATFGTAGHIYHGSLTTEVAEETYSTSTNGAGRNDDSARSVNIGNKDNATPANAWVGSIAVVGVVNRSLTLAELQSLQFHPRVISGTILFTWVGFNGTGTQPDLSGNGNNGTVTGTTVSDNAPLGIPFSR